jgi:hypothetical protein
VRKNDGTLTRQRATFANLLLPYGGLARHDEVARAVQEGDEVVGAIRNLR